jgi:hypothetical protein
MGQAHTQERRIVDDRGVVLFCEITRVVVDGESVRVNSERRVQRCPTCGSRLDKAAVVGRCWEPDCGKQLCTNCGTKEVCCGRTLCEEHRHMAMLNDKQYGVCSEHLPDLLLRQKFHDASFLFDQELKVRLQRHQVEIQERDMRLREFVASSQSALGGRQQVLQEAVARQRLYIEHARLRMEQLRVYAPTAYGFLTGYGQGASLPRGRG